jgi:preprotein translocase subunit SecY
MWKKIEQIWNTKDIRNNILFVVAMLVVFRLASHIPVPGVDLNNLRSFFAGNQVLGMLNLFSGGTMENFSIVMLGVAPYITASIIIQLLTMIVPSLEELSKEGESGHAKINMYTRYLTVPLAFLQSYAMIRLLTSTARPVLTDLSMFRLVTIMFTITAGTMFLVWLGELISEKKVGNGMSLLIFAGIVAALPQTVRNALVNYTSADFYTYAMFLLVAVLTVVGVVFINEGQRNIPVNYAKQMRGNRTYGGSSTHLPMRVNMAGVIPIIFAISIILFPTMIAQFFVNARSAWLAEFAKNILQLFNGQLFYGIAYFVLVFFFTFFYTAVIFHPQKIAENLQRQGGFVPGIRPGKETEKYLQSIMNRINLAGALFLGVIAVLPMLIQGAGGSAAFRIGGTSLLIAVSVAIETSKQIESQITMHEYDRI